MNYYIEYASSKPYFYLYNYTFSASEILFGERVFKFLFRCQHKQNRVKGPLPSPPFSVQPIARRRSLSPPARPIGSLVRISWVVFKMAAACPEEKSSSPKEPLKICSENTVNHERRKNCYNELSNFSKNHENFSEVFICFFIVL